MSFVMTRSFAENMGVQWPPEMALKEGDYPGQVRYVTWEELHARRRQRQSRRLDQIRAPLEPAVVPCYVWTFHNDWVMPYGGWWCYVVARQFRIGVNRYRIDEPLALSIMRALPLGLFPIVDNFEKWMVELATQHPRSSHQTDSREAGVVFGWLEDRQRFTRNRPKGDLSK